jgi:hypothetical protein
MAITTAWSRKLHGSLPVFCSIHTQTPIHREKLVAVAPRGIWSEEAVKAHRAVGGDFYYFLALSHVSAGSNHTCVRYTANNAVYCWGVRTQGALGVSNPGPPLGVPTVNNHVRYRGSGAPGLAF